MLPNTLAKLVQAFFYTRFLISAQSVTDDRAVVSGYVIDTTADYCLLCKQERVRNGVKIDDLKVWALFLESFVIGGPNKPIGSNEPPTDQLFWLHASVVIAIFGNVLLYRHKNMMVEKLMLFFQHNGIVFAAAGK